MSEATIKRLKEHDAMLKDAIGDLPAKLHGLNMVEKSDMFFKLSTRIAGQLEEYILTSNGGNEL